MAGRAYVGGGDLGSQGQDVGGIVGHGALKKLRFRNDRLLARVGVLQSSIERLGYYVGLTSTSS